AQGRPEEAREEAARALDLCPYSVAAIEFSANLCQAAGEFAKCAQLRQTALALNPWHAELHRQLADVLYEELGDSAGALEHYRRYVELEQMRKEAAR
ncbi:MAG: bacterial transcriptional activator domain-containing protein, partial [Candidatus Brocadiae bacterium]|nr:bacterial transcriptional activator domain-containing protein [Candidatus Brocadiia bacterium]